MHLLRCYFSETFLDYQDLELLMNAMLDSGPGACVTPDGQVTVTLG